MKTYPFLKLALHSLEKNPGEQQIVVGALKSGKITGRAG